MKFAQKLACILAQKHWSARRLADEVGIANSTVSEWLRGKNIPQARIVQRVATRLGVAADDLMDDSRELPAFQNIPLAEKKMMNTADVDSVRQQIIAAIKEAKRENETFVHKLDAILNRLKKI